MVTATAKEEVVSSA